jgi:hypothetical protein
MRVIVVMGLVVVVGLVVAFCGGAAPEVGVDAGIDVGRAVAPAAPVGPGGEVIGRGASEGRADAARPEAVDREPIPVAMCTMTGQVIDTAGKRVVGSVALERVGSGGEKVTVDTDGAGGFEVRLPDVGGALRIVASASGARRGERVVEVPTGSRERNLGVVVVHHFVQLTVRLRVGAAQHELLGGEGKVRAQIVHQGAGLAQVPQFSRP